MATFIGSKKVGRDKLTESEKRIVSKSPQGRKELAKAEAKKSSSKQRFKPQTEETISQLKSGVLKTKEDAFIVGGEVAISKRTAELVAIVKQQEQEERQMKRQSKAQEVFETEKKKAIEGLQEEIRKTFPEDIERRRAVTKVKESKPIINGMFFTPSRKIAPTETISVQTTRLKTPLSQIITPEAKQPLEKLPEQFESMEFKGEGDFSGLQVPTQQFIQKRQKEVFKKGQEFRGIWEGFIEPTVKTKKGLQETFKLISSGESTTPEQIKATLKKSELPTGEITKKEVLALGIAGSGLAFTSVATGGFNVAQTFLQPFESIKAIVKDPKALIVEPIKRIIKNPITGSIEVGTELFIIGKIGKKVTETVIKLEPGFRAIKKSGFGIKTIKDIGLGKRKIPFKIKGKSTIPRVPKPDVIDIEIIQPKTPKLEINIKKVLTEFEETIPIKKKPTISKLTDVQKKVLDVVKEQGDSVTGQFSRNILLEKKFTRPTQDIDISAKNPLTTKNRIVARLGERTVRVEILRVKGQEIGYTIKDIKTGKTISDVALSSFTEEGFGIKFPKKNVEGIKFIDTRAQLLGKTQIIKNLGGKFDPKSQLSEFNQKKLKKTIKDVEKLTSETVSLSGQAVRGGFGFSFGEQTQFSGLTGDIATAQRGIFGIAKPKELVVGKKGVVGLEESLFASPFDPKTGKPGVRVSRLGIGESAGISDVLKGEFTLFPQKPQILLFRDTKIGKIPKQLEPLVKKGEKGDVRAIETLRREFSPFQETPTGEFKPLGFIGSSELEVTLPPGEIVIKKGKLGTTLIKGKRVPIFDVEIGKATLETTKLLKKAKKGIVTQKDISILEKRLSKETGFPKQDIFKRIDQPKVLELPKRPPTTKTLRGEFRDLTPRKIEVSNFYSEPITRKSIPTKPRDIVFALDSNSFITSELRAPFTSELRVPVSPDPRIPFSPEPRPPFSPEPRPPFSPEPRPPFSPEPRPPFSPEPRPPFSPEPRPPIKEPPFTIPRLKFKKKKERKKEKETGYNALIREKGKLTKANKKLLPKREATRLVKDVLENSLSASGRVTKSKSMVPSSRRSKLATGMFNNINFRIGKTKKTRNFIVEKRNARLNSVGEIAGITASRLLSRRRKQAKSLLF